MASTGWAPSFPVAFRRYPYRELGVSAFLRRQLHLRHATQYQWEILVALVAIIPKRLSNGKSKGENNQKRGV
jgi:hypothetical protein